ncbi:MAG: glycosyl transferase [Alphaproteobacteria bacterium HGW-Alphaproteobacteria-2]|nr:MAG: glycosyl transferase [Alphaproteobacteria bacterium HGW-Alphaproteobacteria-2]
MRAPLSVVIPTLNAGAHLPATLSSLGEGLAAGLLRELVVSDGGSHDATRTMAEAAGAVLVAGPPGRGGQLRRGAAAAGGPWLLFLHADTVLLPGWADAVARHMARRPGRAGWFRLAFDAEGLAPRLVAGWANMRARAFALPYGDQGLLIARPLYEAAGGFDDMPLMEDVALVRRLGRARLAPLPATALTGAERYIAEGWLRRGARNLGTLARYALGADPARLAERYQRR